MTRDDIIRMAVECQLVTTGNRDGVYMDALERFATRVAITALAENRFVAASERKPLPDEHLTSLCRQHWDRQANILDHIAYARAIERAHGIGGEE